MDAAAAPGPLHRVDAAVIGDDPFWAAVRRRHPDVDLVLLPRRAGGATSDCLDRGRDELRAVVEAWRWIAPLLVERGAADRTAGWRGSGSGHRFVIETAVRGIDRVARTDLLRALAVGADRAGWRLAAGERRGLPVLRALQQEQRLHLRVEAGPGATVLRLRGAPLRLGAADRAVLEQEGSSWE
ncbi:hypothetical protein FXB39_09910 [Nocardioides sp. BGMRC 2183]|nr:hypothetical protein FXB39_09910 [Nocardioides sp. BGMRC 2183]